MMRIFGLMRRLQKSPSASIFNVRTGRRASMRWSDSLSCITLLSPWKPRCRQHRHPATPHKSAVHMTQRMCCGTYIVHDHGGNDCGDDCPAKHVARMHPDGVQGSDRDHLAAFDPAPGVKKQHGKTFTLRAEIRIG